jgi:cell division protein FtsB
MDYSDVIILEEEVKSLQTEINALREENEILKKKIEGLRELLRDGSEEFYGD